MRSGFKVKQAATRKFLKRKSIANLCVSVCVSVHVRVWDVESIINLAFIHINKIKNTRCLRQER